MPRLTARGLGLTTAAVILLIAAGASGLRPLAWPGGLLLGLVAAAALLTWRSARKPALRRSLAPDRVPAGLTVRATLELGRTSVNLGAWGFLEDTVPEGLGAGPMLPVPSGRGRLTSRHRYQLATVVRGRYRIGPSRWTTIDPLGLTTLQRRLGGLSLLTVTPAVHRLDQAAPVVGAGLVGEAARQHSIVLGPDDVLIRDYRPRDELRRIHWPSTARTGKLMVRREEHAWEPSATILLDNRRAGHTGRGPRSSFEWAVSAAASIGVHLLDAGYDIGLVDAGGQCLDADSETLRESLLDHLTDSTLTEAGDLDGALHTGVGGRAQLFIAIIGRLSVADAVALTAARRHGALCRAIVLHPVEPGPDDPLEILVANGWRVIPNAGLRSIADTWAALGEGTGR
ncbi:MAG: DUF58 domain-containing protein [Micropruina sp.]